MSFLKKKNVPQELPDLALGNSGNSNERVGLPKPISIDSGSGAPEQLPPQMPQHPVQVPEHHSQVSQRPSQIPQHHSQMPEPPSHVSQHHSQMPGVGLDKIDEPVPVKREIAGQDYLEFKEPKNASHEAIKETISKELEAGDHESFFNQMLEDINGEIKDLGKLEEWYKNKFLPQDVVSDMRGYWEDNKADIIIKSFGSEYKQKINGKIKKMQELEADWREIYFRLIKKEEEMKKEERELKETLSIYAKGGRRTVKKVSKKKVSRKSISKKKVKKEKRVVLKKSVGISKKSVGISRKGVKRNKLVKGIFLGGIIAAVILLLLILSDLGLFEGASEPQLFVVVDECNIVMGNLIHPIKDDGDCKVRCINECGIREMEFSSIEFEIAEEVTCNSCNCYCK